LSEEISGVDVQALVDRCLEQAKGDAVAAAKLLQSEITKDHALYRNVMTRYENDAWWKLIRREKKSRGEPAWLPPNYNPSGTNKGVKALAQANWGQLMKQQQKQQTKKGLSKGEASKSSSEKS
jgi:hypothetical protein